MNKKYIILFIISFITLFLFSVSTSVIIATLGTIVQIIIAKSEGK